MKIIDSVTTLNGVLSSNPKSSITDQLYANSSASIVSDNDEIDYKTEYLKTFDHLLKSEETLKEAEHSAWHARAEASELLFSLELSQKSLCDAKKQLAERDTAIKLLEMTLENTSTKQESDTTDNSLVESISRVYQKFNPTAEIVPCESMLSAIERRMDEERSRVMHVEAGLVASKADYLRLQEELSARVSTLEDVESKAETDSALLRGQISALTQQLRDKESELIAMMKLPGGSNYSMEHLRLKCEALESDNGRFQREVEQLTRSLQETSVTVLGDDSNKSDQAAVIASMQQQLLSYEKMSSENEVLIEEQRRALLTSEQHLNRLEAEQQRRQGECSEVDKERTQLLAALTESNNAVAQSKIQLAK
jgi:chromosome segregation ATPase